MGRDTLHIMMYPWFAIGHLTAFMRLANKLAQRGHKISFFLPPNTLPKVTPHNLHPHLITLIPIAVPVVEGLPFGAETTNDIPFPLQPLIMKAMDRTETDIKLAITSLKPDFVFFDFTHWLPALARRLGVKSVHYCSMSSASVAYLLVPARLEENPTMETTKVKLMSQPQGFPSNSSVMLKSYEAQALSWFEHMEFGAGDKLGDGGKFCDYVKAQFGKPVLLSGPVIPDSPLSRLEDRWDDWLKRFERGSVVYCSFGSECVLKKEQYEEVLLGLEMTGRPFLVALRLPEEAKTVEEAMPEGFSVRVEGRGVVHEGWMQQQLILGHDNVGCFVTHCGSGSISEALASECRLVLVPQMGDQYVNARVVGGEWKVGVEVERREEDGWFGSENLFRAVQVVMDGKSRVGKEIRENHKKWKEYLLRDGLEGSYIDGFIKDLQDMLEVQDQTC
ncbi:hypothetical protein Sjap_025850 [Stephania japonica]|uniref:Glycosyltransferase n=1 Tax=Stephania japonica TaxID=461633 RepID=A0AAP0HG00_9MAGN